MKHEDIDEAIASVHTARLRTWHLSFEQCAQLDALLRERRERERERLIPTSERIIRECWAAIRPDGQIAGDGNRELSEPDRKALADRLAGWNRVSPNYLEWINNLRPGESFRIAKVRVTEVESEAMNGK